MRIPRLREVFLSVVLFLLASGSTAFAADVHWAAAGRATYDGGGAYLSQGVYVRSRMYAKPVLNKDWVNSAYAFKDDGDCVEAGWYWTPSGSTRQWFTVRVIDGQYTEVLLNSVPVFATDSWISLHVRRNSPSNQYYDVYINGTKYYSWLSSMTSCRAVVASERYDTSTQNKGAWLYAQTMRLRPDNTFEWVYWPHAERVPSYMLVGDDPIYDFWWNYVDRSDHYVYCDDHQN